MGRRWRNGLRRRISLGVSQNFVVSLGDMSLKRGKVLIVGGGAGGIIAGREFLKHGREFCLFEENEELGGVWRYSPAFGYPIAPPESGEYSSVVYEGLRTNLPKEIMRLSGVPFTGGASFPSHSKVLSYLQRIGEDLPKENVRLGAKVVGIGKDGDLWRVRARVGEDELVEEGGYLVVANGHFRKPFIPSIPHWDRFKGDSIHSAQYRSPAPFTNKRVLVVGYGPSGTDVAEELSHSSCKSLSVSIRGGGGEVGEVRIGSKRKSADDSSSSTTAPSPLPPTSSPVIVGEVVDVDEEGCLVDEHGMVMEVDVVIFATGYFYDVSGVGLGEDVVRVEKEGKEVSPLHAMLVSARSPTAAFVGLPFGVNPFPLIQAQAIFLCSLWTPTSPYPSNSSLSSFFTSHPPPTRPSPRGPHHLGLQQWEYTKYLLQLAGEEGGGGGEGGGGEMEAGKEVGGGVVEELVKEIETPLEAANVLESEGLVQEYIETSPLGRLPVDETMYVHVSAARSQGPAYRNTEYRFWSITNPPRSFSTPTLHFQTLEHNILTIRQRSPERIVKRSKEE